MPLAFSGLAVLGQQLAPGGARADELSKWGVQVKCREVGQAAAGGPVLPTPPVAGSISSNAAGPGWAGTLSYKRDEETFAGSYGGGSAYYVSPGDDELEIPVGGPKPEAHAPQRRSEGQCSSCFLLVPAQTLSQTGRCQDCA